MKSLGAWLLAGAAGLAGLANGLASTDTITWGGDNSRSGYQTNHNMDPSVVGSNQFGQIFKILLPGNYGGAAEQIFSQPLVYTPNNGTTQYVYWATTQNNLYKMNAKTGEIVAKRNLHIPFLTADLDGCVDINPNIGITATGVIDPTTETLYLTAKTYLDQTVLNKAQGRPAGRYYVHAIDVNDLTERPNFPVNLENLKATNNPERIFTGGIHHQRPGLLQLGDYVYAGFASHCVQYDFSGWIIGWHKTTGKIVESWATEGANVPVTTKGGGVWMSGGGLASDDAGSMFFATGNGYASQLATIPVKGFEPPTSQEESAVHMTVQPDGSLKIVDFFMPWEKQALDGADKDLGCSPLELLPPEFGCGDIKRVGVITGKSGKTYWLNMDNLGGYRNGPDNRDAVIQVYQNDNSVYAGAGVYPLEGGYVYINVIQHPSNIFKYSCVNGVLSFPKVATTAETNAYILGVSHGTTTSLNGQPGTGLFWVTDVQGLGLRIYNAVPQSGTMNMINSFSIPGVNKFTRPVFGDGLVYIGTNQGYVYAFGSPVNSPLNCTSPTDFGRADIKSNSTSKQVTCTANIAVTVTGVELSDTNDFAIVAPPSVPFDVAKGSSFKVSATFSPSKVGLLSADIIVNTTNSVTGYSVNSHARLTGTGESTSPLLDVAPNTVTFDAVVVGEDPDGVQQQFLINNLGNAKLTIQQVQYSANNASGPSSTWDGNGDLVVGQFTVKNIPTTLEGHNSSSVTVIFNSSTAGTYSAFLKFVSDGGTKSISIAASAGPAAKAVFEFQTPDGQGWVQYVKDKPFDFGNVTENQSRPLKFRITNGAPSGGVKLSLTVSKPPFGVSGLIKAANQVDLAEGTSLAPGESGTAVLTCSAPKTQWNVAPTNGTAGWTINTNDPVMGKQMIQFYCTAVAEQAPPLLSNGLGQYRYQGCYLENNPGRQLQTQLYGNDNNTNAMCIAACAAGKYRYCGTQYHRECWAGNYIPTKQVDDRNCNFDCSGDLNQICGGNGDGGASYISLFVDTNSKDTGPPTGPSVNPGVSGYSSIGCYTEATTGRALPNGAAVATRTVKGCVDACKVNNYVYAGLEYGGECWCGNAFAAGAVPAPLSDCNMVCNDNGTEFCGAGSRLNVYKLGGSASASSSSVFSTDGGSTTATSLTLSTFNGTASTTTTPPPTTTTSTSTSSSTPTPTGPARKAVVNQTWNLQGCWTEATNQRALSDRTYADDKMTLESCATFCKDYTYFGVEYGRECYCGNKLNDGSVQAKQADCSFTCPGDGSEYCGAGNRLELYKVAPADYSFPPDSSSSRSSSVTATTSSAASSTVAATTTSVTSSTATASSATSSSATATASSTSSSPSTSSSSSTSSTSVTSTSTTPTSATSSATTSISSTSTATTSTTTSALSSTTSTTTSTTTSKTSSSTTTTAQPTSTSPVISQGNANYTYYGCFSEPNKGRLLSTQIYNNATDMTIGKCLQKCDAAQAGYNFAGVEYGQECWCGTSLRLDGGQSATTPGMNVSGSDCKFLCPGNKTEYCGAGVRLSTYVLKSWLLKQSKTSAPVKLKY
ncbi:Pyrrolo-quinoline quinone [Cordyceps javanica]|uniref:Pyrrolo-quinoline quinone n=1 Tax=Cordyceps javanica TaxID=43265 RepID=A0A545V089_9HYPO|nr:Pyrrolo-quinoline quinone [Cordyceps javanica]TQW05668.1 Pyrrolo-quinoline quinone [Cordyceps javanica]